MQHEKQRFAVTGATGFVGEKLVERLVHQGHIVHAIARNEGRLIELREKFKTIEIFPCPVEDEYLVRKAVKNCSGIYHLASLKEVNLAGKHAFKTVQTNISGTLSILKASADFVNIRFVVAASSDKAETISSIYGASKFLAEKLVEEFSHINSNCKYRVVRFGNIMHSTSSVLVKWKKAILNGNDIVITDPAATRYFLTQDEAIDLLFECLEKATDSRPYFTRMKSMTMKELLNLMILKYGKDKSNRVLEIGLQDGENKHEKIHAGHSSEMAERWDAEELLRII